MISQCQSSIKAEMWEVIGWVEVPYIIYLNILNGVLGIISVEQATPKLGDLK